VQHVFEFFRTANTAKTALVCATLLIALVIFLLWAAVTRATVKFTPPEISAPESEQMKACRTIQAALHDEILTLENERRSAYTTMDNNHNALNEQTRLRMDARERDRGVAKETGDSSFSVNEEVVIDSVNELIKDINYRNEIISWIRQEITVRSERVYSLCATIIEAGSGRP
jgi:hypothetical protein